jgi:hypothetical protein
MSTKAKLSLATLAAGSIAVAVITLASITVYAAANQDFNGVVSAVEHRYSVHAQRIPMMGFISLCTHAATAGGVKGMQVAEFDHLALTHDGDASDKNQLDELNQLVTSSLGSEWHRLVTERDASGSLSLIFVRPDGPAMRMMIADYDHGELDLVRVEVNADRMEHWIREPEDSARNHHGDEFIHSDATN